MPGEEALTENAPQLISEMGVVGLIVVAFLLVGLAAYWIWSSNQLKKAEINKGYTNLPDRRSASSEEVRDAYQRGVSDTRYKDLNLELQEHKAQNEKDKNEIFTRMEKIETNQERQLERIFDKIDDIKSGK